MSSVRLSGNAGGTGIFTIESPNSNNSRTVSIPDGTGTMVVNNVNSAIVSDTAKSATSTSVDFTGIPSWVKRITVMFSGVSTNGVSQVQVQIGSGSFTTSGYSSYATSVGNAVATSGNVLTSGFHTFVQNASSVRHGHMIITNITGNTWVASHAIGDAGASFSLSGGGNVALSGVLDRVRITTVNGTDAFDAGTINILYE